MYESGNGFLAIDNYRHFIVGCSDFQKLLHIFCLLVYLRKGLVNISFMETKLHFLGSVMIVNSPLLYNWIAVLYCLHKDIFIEFWASLSLILSACMVSETCQSHGQTQVSFPVTKEPKTYQHKKFRDFWKNFANTKEAFFLCIPDCWVLN